MRVTIHTVLMRKSDSKPVGVAVDFSFDVPCNTPQDRSTKDVPQLIELAIENSGFVWPRETIEYNVASELMKDVGSLHLPIAVGILAAHGQFKSELLERYAIVGALAADGSTRQIDGARSIATAIATDGSYRGIILPTCNAIEVTGIGNLKVIPVGCLLDAIRFLVGDLAPYMPSLNRQQQSQQSHWNAEAAQRYADSLPVPPWRNNRLRDDIEAEDRTDEQPRHGVFEAQSDIDAALASEQTKRQMKGKAIPISSNLFGFVSARLSQIESIWWNIVEVILNLIERVYFPKEVQKRKRERKLRIERGEAERAYVAEQRRRRVLAEEELRSGRISPADVADEERRQRLLEQRPDSYNTPEYWSWQNQLYLGGSANSAEWRARARAVKERDDWKCKRCGGTMNLETDHIIPVTHIDGHNRMSNLQTLCHSCHEKKHNRTFGRSG